MSFRAWKTKDTFVLQFTTTDKNLFFTTLENVKAINGRRYDPNTRTWSIPATMENVEMLEYLQFTITDDIKTFGEVEKQAHEKIESEIQKINFYDSNLREYQNNFAPVLIHSLFRNGAAIDASDTGTGKTYTALAIAKFLGKIPVVICPKPAIYGWRKVAEYMDIEINVTNYEQVTRGNSWFIERSGKSYKWNLTEHHIVIVDEVHKAKNSKTLNAKMVRSITNWSLLLSATIGHSPLDLYSVGQRVGMFQTNDAYWRWAYSRGVKSNGFGLYFPPNNKENLQKINQDLFPKYGGRISVNDLGDAFPDNQIIADPLLMDTGKEIQEMYFEIIELNKQISKDKASVLVEILRARQKIELLKVPVIVSMVEDLIEEGKSVAIFVNFTQTILSLSERLKTNCIIDGKTKNRIENMENFQADKERIILCNVRAGGASISLHDLHGNYPRVSLISPPQSSFDLIQVFGRIWRNGAKSKATQKLIFAAETIEEEMAKSVTAKADNINLINDGDLIDSLYTKTGGKNAKNS